MAVLTKRLGGMAMFGALTLSACVGNGSDGPGDLSLEGSPISRTLGINFTAPAESQDQFAEQQRVAEEQIVVCMAAEGFEYIPQNQSFEALDDPFGEALQLSPHEFATQHGWGFVTLVGFVQTFDSAADPNWEYANSLSDSERDKFYVELYGEQPDINLSNSTEEEANEAFENFESTGCSSTAYAEVSRGRTRCSGSTTNSATYSRTWRRGSNLIRGSSSSTSTGNGA